MPDIFPALTTLGWSVTRSVYFQTRIQRARSGNELRALDYPFPIRKWTLTYEVLREFPEQLLFEMQSLAGFFGLKEGAARKFLYSDPIDRIVVGQGIGIGDGITPTFQLQRAIGGGVSQVVTGSPDAVSGGAEPITAPENLTQVYVGGVPFTAAGYGLSSDSNTGLVTLTPAPPAGVIITADFSYWWRVRFVDDALMFERFLDRRWTLKKLELISVFL